MAKADVDRPVAAGGETGERARSARRRRQVSVSPANDVVDEIALPRSRPLAGITMHGRATDRHHSDEGADHVARDEVIGNLGEPHAVDVGGRPAAHAVQQIDHGIAIRCGRFRRKVDGAQPAIYDDVVRDPSQPNRPAVGAHLHEAEAARQQ
jgi:hypothetical protein